MAAEQKRIWHYVEERTHAGLTGKVVDGATGGVIALVKRSGKDQNAGPTLAAAPALLAKCEKVAIWLEGLAASAEKKAKDCGFITLREAYEWDAKNYRNTAADIRSAMPEARS